MLDFTLDLIQRWTGNVFILIFLLHELFCICLRKSENNLWELVLSTVCVQENQTQVHRASTHCIVYPSPTPMFLFKKHYPEQVELETLNWFSPPH